MSNQTLALLDAPVPAGDPDAERLLEHARDRGQRGAARREVLTETASSGVFLLAAAALALAASSSVQFDWGIALLFTAVYAIVSRVHFEIGSGFTSPVQLVLFPMLLTLPPQAVPLLVAAGITASIGWDVARRSRHPTRLLAAPGQAWHALGPALVLVLAPTGALTVSDAPVILCAFMTQVVVDLGTSMIVDRVGVGIPLTTQLGSAWWVYVSDALLMPPAVLATVVVQDHPATIVLLLPLFLLLQIFARERSSGIDRALELSRAYRGTAFLLGDVVEADDAYTGAHSRDVVGMSLEVARRMGLDARQCRNVEFAALLHDVGKIRVPKEIINSPNPLTPEERKIIEQHTVEGERMLQRVGGVLDEVGHIVRASHEDYDGSGYPDGLAAEAIPIEARICSCCDAFSAMTTDRSYRAALPLEAAIEELRANAGTQFDPNVVSTLIDVIVGSPGNGHVQRPASS
jgi:putative nucleotidyltransferase with HDIG domain